MMIVFFFRAAPSETQDSERTQFGVWSHFFIMVFLVFLGWLSIKRCFGVFPPSGFL